MSKNFILESIKFAYMNLCSILLCIAYCFFFSKLLRRTIVDSLKGKERLKKMKNNIMGQLFPKRLSCVDACAAMTETDEPCQSRPNPIRASNCRVVQLELVSIFLFLIWGIPTYCFVYGNLVMGKPSYFGTREP